MIKQYDNTMEICLRERALETQQSVEAKRVDAVHRHKVAAQTSQVALTTETNKLKEKHQKSKEMEKARERGKAGRLREMTKDITNILFNKRSKEDSYFNNPGTTRAVEKEATSTPYEPAIEANVTKAELAAAKENWLRKKRRGERRRCNIHKR